MLQAHSRAEKTMHRMIICFSSNNTHALRFHEGYVAMQRKESGLQSRLKAIVGGGSKGFPHTIQAEHHTSIINRELNVQAWSN